LSVTVSEGAELSAAAQISAAVRRLTASREELTAALLTLFGAEIAPLHHDDAMRNLLEASTDESVAAALYVLEQGVDPRLLGAPPAAISYARRLAQRGIPVSALLRAYRLGHSAFIEVLLSELAADPDSSRADTAAASVQLLRVATAYVDSVSELLVAAYEEERAAWTQHHSIVRTARINALLEGDPVDLAATEAALGYRLGQTHLAALLWFDRPTREAGEDMRLLERVCATAAAVHGGQHVFLPTDESSAAVWIGVPADLEQLDEVVKALLDTGDPAPRLALGRPEPGARGFRDSSRQAEQARTVALAAGRHAAQVTSFSDVGAIALLCADLPATRVWVADTRGALAVDDEDAERLRETVRVFLNLGSSHTAAAKLLNLHKNSVQYRIAKAEALRGRPFRSDRADIELALRACRVLGPAVLKPAT
jgi:DNA-binding PucR family transcriptional regulator